MPPAEFDLHCEELMLMLDERLRVYAMLRVMGYTNREIAAQLDCTERKVERKLHLIRLRWEDELAD
jgi:DNA-directed RNA polymerase specialized sigma24 family protein